MLREEPFGFFGTIGSVNPTTREVTEGQALQTKIASKKAAKPQKQQPADPQRPFTDDQFRCLPSDLEGLEGQKLVWSRLSDIVTPKGSLFASKYFSNFTTMLRNPSFLSEIGLLPPFYYQSLFLTPDFTPNGMYKVIVNVQGQFRIVVVDDIIPVYESNMQPIWGLDRNVPWELILLKVWAKVVGGFKNIHAAKPFQFLRTFTYPNWRLKNIDKYDTESAWRFLSSKLHNESAQQAQLSRQTNFQELSHAKPLYDYRPGETNFTLIAKTKNSEEVARCGLMPNAAAYQIVKLFEVQGRKKAIKIASSIPNRWSGQFSVLDQRVNQFYDPNFHDLTLSKSFIMPFEDFRKLFGLILISPINYKQYLSTKHNGFTVDLQPNHKSAQYYRLNLKEPGQVSFSIIQAMSNLVQNVPRPPPPPQAQNSSINRSQVLQQSGVQPMGGMALNMSNARPLSTSSMSAQIPSTPLPNYIPPELPVSSLGSSGQANSRIPQAQFIPPPPIMQPPNYSGMQPPSPTQIRQPQSMVMQPPIDPWMNRNPWANPPTAPAGQPQSSTIYQPPMGSGMASPNYQSNSRTIISNVAPPAMPPPSYNQYSAVQNSAMRPPSSDPWLNTNPWGNPPTVQPGSSAINQPWGNPSIGSSMSIPPQPWNNTSTLQPGTTIPMQPPPGGSYISAGMPARPPSSDPWLNTNPWGNPPTIQGSSISMQPPPVTATYPPTMISPPPMPMMNPPSYSIPPVNPVMNAQQGSMYRPPSSNIPVPVGNMQIDPWKNTNPWGNPPTAGIGAASGPIMLNPGQNTGSRTIVQQQTTTSTVYQPQMIGPPSGTMGPSNNGSLLLPELSYGVPPAQVSGSNYVSHPPPPSIPVSGVQGAGSNYTGGASNYMGTTTNNYMGVGGSYAPPMSPNPSYSVYPNAPIPANQGPGLTMPSRQQATQMNPWLNTNPWSNPPTAGIPAGVPTGMRGGGGPVGLSVDPWLNTNPWSNPPVPQGQGSNAGYFQQFGSGIPIGGGSAQNIPSPHNSQIQYTNAVRPISPLNQQNYYVPPPPTSPIHQVQSPLQPMTSSYYTYVPQNIANSDPWKNVNPWSGPPTVGGAPVSGIMPVSMPGGPYMGPTGPMGPIGSSMQQQNQMISPVIPQNQYGSNLAASQQLSGSQMGMPMQQGYQPSMSPPKISSTVQSAIPHPISPTRGSAADPWTNYNPWSNPPAVQIETATHYYQSQPPLPQMSALPPNLPPYQANMNQSNLRGPGLAGSGSNYQTSPRNMAQEEVAIIKPPAVQPLMPPLMHRQDSQAMPNQMTGASIASLQGGPQISQNAGFQAYVPPSAQLRFLKMKIVLARLVDNKYNIATIAKGGNVIQDELNQPEDGYEYVDIDQTHGYTAGESYFFKLPPGEYILHVKPEACAHPTSYTINFISQVPLQISPVSLDKRDKSLLLRSCFLDYARDKGALTYLNPSRSQWVSYGPTFNELGYGYIAFCAEKGSPERLYCEFNQRKLRDQGYICKDIYKNRQNDIGVFSENGMGRCLLLKQLRPNAVWPPNSVMIYKAQ